MKWRAFKDEKAPDHTDLLVTDGGFIVSATWEEVDYDEFRGRSIMGWHYGPAEIDGSNFSPTHWMLASEMPEVPADELPADTPDEGEPFEMVGDGP